jgi:hypothetical protein
MGRGIELPVCFHQVSRSGASCLFFFYISKESKIEGYRAKSPCVWVWVWVWCVCVCVCVWCVGMLQRFGEKRHAALSKKSIL